MAKDLTNCILCGQHITPSLHGLYDTHFGVPDLFDISYCSKCGLGQTTPQPTSQEIKEYYIGYYNFGGEKNTFYTRLRKWFLASFFYRLWLMLDGDVSFHSKKGSGRLLDIGCNEGRGLQIYQRNGFSVEGLELNDKAVLIAREKGFKVYSKLIEEYHPESLYDIVILSNVIEHVLNPKEVIGHINRVLKTGGVLWLSCPNGESVYRHLFKLQWINWHVPFHLTHFNKKLMERLLEESGFTVKTSKTVTPSLLIAQSILCSLFGERGKPTKKLRNPFWIGFLMLFFRIILFPILFVIDKFNQGADLVIKAEKL